MIIHRIHSVTTDQADLPCTCNDLPVLTACVEMPLLRITIITTRSIGEQDSGVFLCLCVFVRVCLLSNLYQISVHDTCLQSSSGGVAIRYVLPVLRMTSYLHIMGHICTYHMCTYGNAHVNTIASSDGIASSCAG